MIKYSQMLGIFLVTWPPWIRAFSSPAPPNPQSPGNEVGSWHAWTSYTFCVIACWHVLLCCCTSCLSFFHSENLMVSNLCIWYMFVQQSLSFFGDRVVIYSKTFGFWVTLTYFYMRIWTIESNFYVACHKWRNYKVCN